MNGGRSRFARLLVRALLLLALAALVAVALGRLEYRWDWARAWAYRERFLHGLFMTLWLSGAAMVVGLGCGVLGALMRISRVDALSFLGLLYVELVRGTPLLVQLLISYYCIAPQLRYDNPPVIGILTLGVFSGAYVTEILRAGVEAVARGQSEAAAALGLSRAQTLWLVVAPQALRRVIPPLAGQFVSLVKDSSLLSLIAVAELTKMAELFAASSLKVFEAYLPLAALYLAITFPLSRLSARLERRFADAGRA